MTALASTKSGVYVSFSLEMLTRRALGVSNLPAIRASEVAPGSTYREARTSEELQRLILNDSNGNGIDAAVNDNLALSVAAVYACVNIIANSIAMLPLTLYRREGNKLVADLTSPVGVLLAARPTRQLTPFKFWRMAVAHVLLRGNFYAQKVVESGQVTTLLPLNPDNVTPKSKDGVTISYEYRHSDRSITTYSSDEIFHLTGLSLDGIRGISVLQAARRAINVAHKAETFAGSLFQNGAKPSGVLKHPKELSAEAIERLKTQFDEMHAGADNANRTLLLEDGTEWQQVQMTAEDSQFMESRGFQRGEVCIFFGVPPQMVGDVDKGTSWGTGIEQQNLGMLTHTLKPYLVNFTQECIRSLIPLNKQALYLAKFDVSELTKADFFSRQQGLQIQRRNGVISANEWREAEGKDPVDDEKMSAYLTDQTLVEDPPSSGAEASGTASEPNQNSGQSTARLRKAERRSNGSRT